MAKTVWLKSLVGGSFELVMMFLVHFENLLILVAVFMDNEFTVENQAAKRASIKVNLSSTFPQFFDLSSIILPTIREMLPTAAMIQISPNPNGKLVTLKLLLDLFL